MLTNPGFSFTGLSGHHEIIPTSETDLPVWGPIYEKTVRCVEVDAPVSVYVNGPGLDYSLASPALEFAGINIYDEAAILAFCDKYGLPGSQRQEANFRNNYIYQELNKDEYAKGIQFGRPKELEWLGIIQKQIVDLRSLFDLNEAVQKGDYYRIIQIAAFYCFDLSGLDFKGSCHVTETKKFNHAFFRFAEECGYDKSAGLGELTLNNLIEGFFDSIELQFDLEHSYNQAGFPYDNPYSEYQFSKTWQHFYAMFHWLQSKTTIESVSPFGDVVLGSDIHDIDITPLTSEGKHLINTAKALLADIFKEKLSRITPELQFNAGNMPEANWRIPSLADAMYLDAFFRLTPTTTVRHCANPTCTRYFTWSSSRKTRIYCCPACAELMAKRKQRERDRAKKAGTKPKKKE